MTWEFVVLLGMGAVVTAALSVVSITVGLAIGVLVCAASLSRAAPLRWFGRTYVSFFRGVPLLVQLLLIYHTLPQLGIDVPGVVAALIGLTLCTSAYQAETLRGGFVNVAPGLMEAGRMVGLNGRQILLRIRAPIALRLTLPALVNEAIMILKASSLVSVVGVGDLTRTALNLASSTFRPLEMFAVAGAYYLLLNVVVGYGGSGLGRLLGVQRA
jgi:polar amino acid transport system permease protein